MKYQLRRSRQFNGYAPGSINPESSIESITRALLDEAGRLGGAYADLSTLVTIAIRRVDRGEIDADDLVRLSVLSFLDQRLYQEEEEIRAVRAEIADLRRHRKLLDARFREDMPSQSALEFALGVATLRERYAEINAIGFAI